MLWTLEQVKANIRNRDGKRVWYLPEGDRLSWEAKDYLSRERIAILPPEEARPQRWRLLGGGFAEEKPEHMTHLDGDTLVPKTHPRIRFRGAMDSLEAELLWCGLHMDGQLRKDLQEILELARRLIRCEVMDEPVEEDKLCGLTQEQLRSHSHRPQDFYGQPHFMPEVTDGEKVLRLNRCRCAARAAELAAAAAFTDENGNALRTDILQAINRMSSMLYILMIKEKGGS